MFMPTILKLEGFKLKMVNFINNLNLLNLEINYNTLNKNRKTFHNSCHFTLSSFGKVSSQYRQCLATIIRGQ